MHKTFSFIPRILSKNIRREKTPASVTQLIASDSRDLSVLETTPAAENTSQPLTGNTAGRDTASRDYTVLKEAGNISNCDISDVDPAIVAFGKSASATLSHSVHPRVAITRDNQPEPIKQESVDENNRTLSLNENPFSCSFVEALMKQTNPPFVDVGSLSPKRKVPFYKRQTNPLAESGQAVCQSVQAVNQNGQSVSQRGYLSTPTNHVQASVPSRQYSHSSQGPAAKRFRNEEGDRKQGPSSGSRTWQYTPCGRQYLQLQDDEPGVYFTVMSYNVLAQRLIEDNRILYQHCKEQTLSWKKRKWRLLSEIKHHMPDVICLQEVQEDHYRDFFKPELGSLGYGSSYLKRTGDKHDGCATFYSQSQFTLDRSVPVKYFVRADHPVLDRDNVALIVKLRPVSRHVPAGRRLCVANTHLLYNPRRGDVKLAQLMMLLAELDKHAYTAGSTSNTYHSMVVCGDFNSEPNSKIYKLMTMGELKYEGLVCRAISGQQEGIQRGRDVYLHKAFLPSSVGISDSCQYTREVVQRATQTGEIKQSGDGIQRVKQSSEVVERAKHTESDTGPGKGGHSGKTINDCIVIDDDDDDDDGEYIESTDKKRQSNAESLSNKQQQSVTQRQSEIEKPGPTFTHSSGTLKHKLKFVSSYPFSHSAGWHDNREVSSVHSKGACMVDYIFYGVREREVRFNNGVVEMRGLVEGDLNLIGNYQLLKSRDIWRQGGLPNTDRGSDHISLMAQFLLK